MNRRSIFRLFAGVLPAFALAKFTAPAKAFQTISYNDELRDGRLPTSIWLRPIPENERYSSLPNQHRIGERWYRGTKEDPAPVDALQYIELPIRGGRLNFTTTGKSGRVYKQSFILVLDVIKQSFTEDQVAICREQIPQLISAGVPQYKWPDFLVAVSQLSSDDTIGGWAGSFCNNGSRDSLK